MIIITIIFSSCNNEKIDGQSITSNFQETKNKIDPEETKNKIDPEERKNAVILTLAEIDFSDISMTTNTYRKISLTIKNNRDYNIMVNIPSGSLFDNLVEHQQDLINLKNSSMNIMSNSFKTIELETACVDPNKASPSTNNWNIYIEIPDNLSAVDGIPSFFENHENKLVWIDKMRKNKIFNTEESKKNFQQMVIWLMLDTDKSTMINFMSQYVYEGNYYKAELFINKYYDETVKIRDTYRDYKETGRINWPDVKDLTKKIPTKTEIKEVIKSKAKSILKSIF